MSRRYQEEMEAERHAHIEETLDRCYRCGADPDDLRVLANELMHEWHRPVLPDPYTRELFEFRF